MASKKKEFVCECDLTPEEKARHKALRVKIMDEATLALKTIMERYATEEDFVAAMLFIATPEGDGILFSPNVIDTVAFANEALETAERRAESPEAFETHDVGEDGAGGNTVN